MNKVKITKNVFFLIKVKNKVKNKKMIQYTYINKNL